MGPGQCSDRPTLSPEVRYSVWYHGEAAQRPSTVLQAGTGDQAWGFDGQGNEQGYRDDTAGVAVDPFDDTAIWMAHTYAAGGPVGCNSQQVAVGKVFGSTRPDLVVSGVAFLPEVVRAGGVVRVSFVASDRGDGAAGPSRVKVSLVGIQRGPSPVLGTVDVAALRPGESRTLDVPSNLPPGSYRVRVTIRPDENAREYSRTNNAAESSSLLPVT